MIRSELEPPSGQWRITHGLTSGGPAATPQEPLSSTALLALQRQMTDMTTLLLRVDAQLQALCGRWLQ